MKIKFVALFSVLSVLCFACDDYVYYDVCADGDWICNKNDVYQCAYDANKGALQWVKSGLKCDLSMLCPAECNGNCNQDGTCKQECNDKCPDKCNPDGTCLCPESCTFGCNSDGTCQDVPCSETCQTSCDTAGKCQCKVECADDCNSDGSCKVVSKCEDTCTGECDEDGNCITKPTCPSDCPDNCDTDGNCLSSCPEECPNNCDSNGKCPSNCPAECPDHCDTDGKCLSDCPAECPDHCDESKQCIPDEYDIYADPDVLYMYKNETSRFVLVFMKNGAPQNDIPFTITSSDINCADITNVPQFSDNKAWIMIMSKNVKCETTIRVLPKDSHYQAFILNLSVDDFSDTNGNHMKDEYEPLLKGGANCTFHSDCDSAMGANDGFCDSFLGYKCSTRCTSDFQCLRQFVKDGFKTQIVCRRDGRCASDTFETEWSLGNSKTITIPVKYSSDIDGVHKAGEPIVTNCNFTIDWGDNGGIETYDTCPETNLTHTYSNAIRNKIVKIKGIYDGFALTDDYHLGADNAINDANAAQLSKVITFGPVGLAPQFAFANATALSAFPTIDIPDSTTLTSLRDAFNNINSGNLDVSNWDTSNVTNLDSTFFSAKGIKGYSSWNTSNVVTMHATFKNATVVSDISKWNTSQVTDMSDMFNNAKFNRNIGNWDVSNVTNMKSMFENATSFNQSLSNWELSSIPLNEKESPLLNMFLNSGLKKQNIDALFNSSNSKNVWTEYKCFLGLTGLDGC